MKDETISFKCIEVEQPIGTFYIGAIPAADIVAIAEADIRRIEARDIEKIVGIQRELNPGRVKKIKQYVGNVDATFPTSVILAVSSDDTNYDKTNRTMRIRRNAAVAKIIDGQHRIAGLDGFQGKFEVNVTVFVDMDLADQAMTFATINLNQTKVSKSLVYDLYEFQHTRSPQKTCHTIARLLNREDKSPLQGRIKILGKAIGQSEYEFITQATFVTELMAYISKDPMKDRDVLMRRKKLEPAEPSQIEKLVLRDLFINEKDALLANIVWNYFDAVAQRWPVAWNSTTPGDILNRTQGFVALMRFLGPVYRANKESGGQLPTSAALAVLKKVRLKDGDFIISKYPPGTSGYTALFRDLQIQSGL